MSTLADVPHNIESRRYTTVAIFLHWLIAVSIIAMLATGLWMVDAIKVPETQALAYDTYQFHKSLGITILALTALRILWRWLNPPPPLPAEMGTVARFAAHATHGLFYALMLALPLTGWAMVSASPFQIPTIIFGLFELPHITPLEQVQDKAAVEAQIKMVHDLAGKLMIGLLLLHVAAALKHQFVDRDHLMARMIPGLATKGTTDQ